MLPEEYQLVKDWSAAGLAAVWARENTRESVFDALAQRETYATSGPRISLRFFGSFNFQPGMMDSTELLQQAYDQGVPMGGVLDAVEPGAAPRFAVWAAKDPEGANLDRLQIVKGWVDAEGRSH